MTTIDFEALKTETEAALAEVIGRLAPQSDAVRSLIARLVHREVFYASQLGHVLPDGWKYRSAERFVLGEGESFAADQVRYDPDVVGTPRNCFEDALMTALENGWYYAEGFAVGASALDVHHAWCVDDDGMVIDPTWQTVAASHDWCFPHAHAAYVGVVLNPDVVARWVSENDVYGILYGPRMEVLLEHGIDGFPLPDWMER